MTGAGRAYVYSGKDGHVLLTLTGERAGDGFGSAVAGGGRQGRIVADRRRSGGRTASTGPNVRLHRADVERRASSSTPTRPGAALGGMFLSVPATSIGDGVPDVYASDFANAAKGPSTGRVYVHSGGDGPPPAHA